MSTCSRHAVRSATALVVLAAGHAMPAHALDIAQTPLFLGSKTQPNFMLALDDSTSMFLETAFPGGNPETLTWDPVAKSFFAPGSPPTLLPPGELTSYFGIVSYPIMVGGQIPPTDDYAFARSPGFNGIYFDPARTYDPWLKADGSRWPPAVATQARLEPRLGAEFAPENAKIIDLTVAVEDQEYGELFPGMQLPAGTAYTSPEFLLYNENEDPDDETDDFLKMSGCGPAVPPASGVWSKLAADAVISYEDTDGNGQPNTTCALKLQTFLPTFYLASPALLPPGYGYIAPSYEVQHAFGPGSASLWRYEIRPENFSDPGAYATAIANFANWFQYHRTRFLSVVASTTEALGDIRDVRIASFKINEPIDVIMRELDVPLNRQAVYDGLTSLQATAKIKNMPTFGGTPNRSAVAHLGAQFRRTDSDAPVQNACQVNVGMLFTDGYTSKGNGPAGFGNADGALDAQFRDAQDDTMADIVTSYFEGDNTPLREGVGFEPGQLPVPGSCKDNPHPSVDCETNLHMKFHAVALGPQGAIYGVDPAATADPYANPPDWDALGSPNATAGPAVIDELWHATLNGRGEFVNAKTPAEVTVAIKDALKLSITNASFTGGIAASSTRRDEGFLAYVPRYSTDDWTGDLTAHVTDVGGQFDAPLWSAAARLEDMDVADRKVWFSDAGKGLANFTVDNLGGEADAVQRLGLPSVTPYGRSVEEVVDYLRGDHAFEERNPGGTLRDRRARIGDIFGSQPEVLTRAGYGYTGLPKAQGGGVSGPGSYGDFLQTTKTTRTPVVFVGANDGMLHAFDASTGANGGRELFAVIPDAVLEHMGELPDPTYKHRYFVDGSPVQGDAWDGAWKTILLVPMGAGGRSIMALDVTDPASSFGPQNFLWEFTDPDLNETLGKPHIVLLEDGRWAAVFGSGIDAEPPGSTQAFLYFVDLFKGELIAKVLAQVPHNEDGIVDDGLINLVPLDTDYDLKADTVYAADYDGFLWRVDIDEQGGIALGNAGKPLYRATNKQGRPQIVTGGIDAFPHHIRGQMVFFGTGRYLKALTDIQPTNAEESFYAIWDDPEQPGFVERADLQVQSILADKNVQGTEARTLTDHPVDWATQRGWALDFLVDGQPLNGEKFIGQPIVALGRVTFATYQPVSANPCSGSGVNRLYSLSAASGVGELLLPGGEGTYGSLEIPAASAGSGPILQPGLVTSPPPPPCVPGSPGCPLPQPDMEGNVLSAPSPGCRTDLGVLLGDGLLTFDRLTCGRQSWQQLQ